MKTEENQAEIECCKKWRIRLHDSDMQNARILVHALLLSSYRLHFSEDFH